MNRRTRCHHCFKLYHGIGTHEARCKAKKKWEAKLDKQGLIEGDNCVHISGGMKIFLTLGRESKTEEGKIFTENLNRFEKKHKATIEYDLHKDEIVVVFHNGRKVRG
jgi:hypothetical protein